MFAWSESLVGIQQFMGRRCFVIAARPPLFSALIQRLNKARGSFVHSPQYKGGKQMFSRVLPETIRFFRRADYICCLVCICNTQKGKNGVFCSFDCLFWWGGSHKGNARDKTSITIMMSNCNNYTITLSFGLKPVFSHPSQNQISGNTSWSWLQFLLRLPGTKIEFPSLNMLINEATLSITNRKVPRPHTCANMDTDMFIVWTVSCDQKSWRQQPWSAFLQQHVVLQVSEFSQQHRKEKATHFI